MRRVLLAAGEGERFCGLWGVSWRPKQKPVVDFFRATQAIPFFERKQVTPIRNSRETNLFHGRAGRMSAALQIGEQRARGWEA